MGIDETGITDVGLASLRDVPNLHYVSANKTRVTKEALAKLNSYLDKRRQAEEKAAQEHAEAKRKKELESIGDPFGR